MTINVVLNPPLPSDDPATFNSKAFSTLGSLNTWAQQANELAEAVSQDEVALSAAVSSASTSAATATTKAGEAVTSETNAAASATSAGSSATTATTKAGEAAASATSAASSATSAGASATTATTKASEAATSEANAAASAATASNAATTATTKASEANTSAVNAASSATAASGAATTATTKASEAVASAANAAASATTATTKAGEASASALAAAEAAQDAIDAAASISGGPVTSVNGQTGVVVLDADDLGLGSAATLNAPATGDAAAGEVVKGNDSRLTNARTPTAHTHAVGDVTDLESILSGKEASISVGTTSQYWRGDKSWRDFFADVRVTTLTGLSTATNAVILATDTVLAALGKLQAQISERVTGQASSVDGEVALFSGTGGKTVKRATGSGLAKLTSGVLSTASAGTDYVTPSGTETLTNKTLSGAILNDGYTEEIYALSGTTPALNPANGSIQTWTLSGNSSPTDSLSNGQSVFLGITASSYTVTWPSVTWNKVGGSGTAPTLTSSGVNWVVLWKVGGTLRGAFLGTA